MAKLKKWLIGFIVIIVVYLIGVQGFQYYLIKGNTQLLIKNNMWSTDEVANIRIYLDGELINEREEKTSFFPSAENLLLKPGKHTILVEWIEKDIKEEFAFFTFFIVKYIWIWLDDYEFPSSQSKKYQLNIHIDTSLLDYYYGLA